ncbi:MAG: arylsulfatase [Phycisphaerae bacterium]|nr:arylsulfatase [Phycisphaerae bacterium]
MINKIKVILAGIVTLFAFSTESIVAGENQVTEKPNVILVITDDQGMGDLACHGNPIIKTPGLDDFYSNAIRFTNFHVSTTCAPTRGALMTGRHTNRLNVFHTISGRSLLFDDEVILPQLFAQNGYATGMFGKWHLGDNYPYRPEDRGFQEVVRHGGGGITQGPDYWMNDYFDDTYWHNGKTKKYQGYCTDVFFAEALKFIEKNKNNPFFCYLSTNAPHSPLNLPKQYLQMYKDQNLPESVQRFYGMITNIDDNFKKLRDKLDSLNLTANTIFVFMTDNGTANGHVIYNAGLRDRKASEYEGGHRVPLFIQWPNGKLTGGKDIDTLVAHYDLLPTFVDLLGFDFKPVKPLDGMSLKPLLYGKGQNWPDRILYVDTQRVQNLVKYKNYSVMNNHWRLVNGKELYNVTKDRGQRNNVIDQHPDVVARLAAGYEKWWQSFMDEGADQRYAYIKVGSPHENPSRISSHDMMTGKFGHWHQQHAARASQAEGIWKVEFVEDGHYTVTLRRFPRESGLGINETFPEQEKTIELDEVMPASTKTDFVKAFLSVADFNNQTSEIKPRQEEVTFKAYIPAGKYDMEAQLIDKDGRVYPAYYIYIERL